MFEQKELYNDGLHSNYGQREGAIVLVCTGAGKIVFVHGDTAVFEMKHSKLIQHNLFSLGFTLLSLIQVAKTHPRGILSFEDNPFTKLRLELLSRNHLKSFSENQSEWQVDKKYFIKVLRLSCSISKATFSQKEILDGNTLVRKNDRIVSKMTDLQEELVVVEISYDKQGQVQARRQDYEYTRELLLRDIRQEELA